MDKKALVSEIFQKKSYLCVGLDTDRSKLPAHLKEEKDGIIIFNKAIIEATKEYCVSYKINTAFYEARGLKGWEEMQETLSFIPKKHFTIADAKRGDIGNTSAQYAKTFFETLDFDSITVAPYMGEDSIRPFLDYENKVTIVLGLTSNKGANDFELQKMGDQFLYEKVLHTVSKWGNEDNLMFVVGATQAHELANIRKIIPQNFLLVPGVGAQGGSLQDVTHYGKNEEIGLLINSSRGIIYADNSENFANVAGEKAKELQQEMSVLFS
ncbi:orotidine-5'-phosphate decarboxylase [Rhizosphaericola mali]|uniref:Orotidine-5'-phosphate decarboxylase n=1 Tax=Rhizosphaericola mali TaxID=2545455 RepID=A0A5P2G0N7_9BACT|nr:orotidine-5'-phosphate decarboxylase [Rhizosphaericola mali]QES88218.1 orotidine-5'-phosphate decarboxylase [Rhizosphaericola mali]